MIKKYVSCLLVLLLILSFSSFAFADSDNGEGDNSGLPTSEVGEDTSMTILRISANDTSGLHSVMLSLIGDYNPIVTDHVYQNYNGYTQHSITVTPDWSWIMVCALFIVVIYSTFRLFGLALGGIK